MATYYVRTTGNDGNGGTNPETDAWLTLQNALDSVSDGDTIDILGDYTPATPLNIKVGHSNKTITIDGGSAITTSFKPAAHAITLDDADVNAVILKFQNMTIQPNNGAANLLRVGVNDAGCSITFEKCTLKHDAAGDKEIFVIFSDAGGVRTNYLRVIDCNIYPDDNGSSPCFKIYDLSELKCTGCTFYTAKSEIFELYNVITTLHISGNTITGATGANDCFFVKGSNLTSITTANIFNNTGTNLENGIDIDLKCRMFIYNNDLTINQDSGVENGINIGSNDTTDESEAVSTLLDDIIIMNNKIRFTGADNAHGIFIGGDCCGAIVANNYVNGGNYGIVIKGKACHVWGNVVVGANTLYLAGAQGCIVNGNTCYCNSGSAFLVGDNNGFGTARNPESNVVINNIFYATSGADYAMSWGAIATSLSCFFDYNCYYGGGTALLKHNNKEYTTLALLLADGNWLAATGTNMDTHSINRNPGFINPASYDFRLANISPCLNTGIRPLCGNTTLGHTTMGSFNPRGTGPTYTNRNRYDFENIYS